MKRKTIDKRSLIIDWENKGTGPIDSKINRIIKTNNTREAHLINLKTNLPKELPEIRFSTIYAYKKSIWEIVGYKCLDCGKLLSDKNVIEKHGIICTKELQINKIKDEFMPIQRIVKNNQVYYRWGNEGKLYKTKEEAERQARAIYASGYREKPKTV